MVVPEGEILLPQVVQEPVWKSFSESRDAILHYGFHV